LNINDLLNSTGEWLRGDGPVSDIVISSRIRLARNLADYPFVSRAEPRDRLKIVDMVRELLAETPSFSDTMFCDISRLDAVDRNLLVERHLISHELAESEGPRLALINGDELFSLMVNEEDHIRLQVMKSGFDLHGVWDLANKLDDEIESKLVYAFDENYGYLTACPTNVGTGLRISVMLHLPALAITREIERVFRGLQRINLTVRGMFGEGSQALGDFYQISNQQTLGRTEANLIEQLSDLVVVIVDYEKKARQMLLDDDANTFFDRISRAYGILKTARTINSEETLHLLSGIRLGVNLGLIEDLGIASVNELFLRIQPAHLQKMAGTELDPADRDIERAKFLRSQLNPNDE